MELPVIILLNMDLWQGKQLTQMLSSINMQTHLQIKQKVKL